MNIGHSEIYWNYTASLLKIAGTILLLPIILRMLPSETVAIWSIFMTVTSLVVLVDFGFNSSFARNVTYVFSGINQLQSKGIISVDISENSVNYGLLKGIIIAMR